MDLICIDIFYLWFSLKVHNLNTYKEFDSQYFEIKISADINTNTCVIYQHQICEVQISGYILFGRFHTDDIFWYV